MKSSLRLALAAVMLSALAACATDKTQKASTEAAPGATDAAVATAIPSSSEPTVERSPGTVGADDGKVDLPPELADRRVVYFPYDSETLSSADLELLAAHAKFLIANPRLKLRLEGHTDERGTREYNIGLGERRAQAVRRTLALRGVAEGSLSTVSYGEEQPAVSGSDEAAMSRNRRVELVYVAP